MRKLLSITLIAALIVSLTPLMGITVGSSNDMIAYAADTIPIDEEHFPDAGFRDYITEMYGNSVDPSIVTELDVSERSIKSLEGLIYFTDLVYLMCNNNNLSSLDISHNTALEYLDCNGNNLNRLDVSHNIALKSLYCGENNLNSLDVSQNTALEDLFCANCGLNVLNVSHNKVLRALDCEANNLSNLDISRNTDMRILNCGKNNLSSLDVSCNTALETLYCHENNLSSLDVSHNADLVNLMCSNNKLSGLDVSHNTALEFLDCYDNSLSSLDISHNTVLSYLDCKNNKLGKLYVGDKLPEECIYDDGVEIIYGDSADPIDEPFGKGFRIPEDTNAFRHSISSFYYGESFNKADLNPIERALFETTYKRKKRAVETGDYFYVITDAWTSVENTLTYPTSDKFYHRLIRGLNEADIATIRNKIDHEWGGSCHGIAVTMCLASQDVNTEENGILKTYNKSGKPKENLGFRNAINFYQLSQYVDWGDDTEITWSPEREPLNYSEEENLGVFLQNLVEEGLKSSRTQKPFVFSFGVHPEEGDDYGHSIVCFGASKYDDDRYTLDLYDENIVDDRNENRYAASFTGYVDLSVNSIEFKEPNGKVIDNSNYRYFSYIGIDDLYGRVASNQTSAGKAKNGKYILLSANKNYTITNDRGETIVYDGGKSSGTMNVYNARMVAQDGDDTMILDVEPYDSLTVTGMDSEMEISGEIGDEFYTASVEGADSIRINDGGIDITGDEYTFTVGTTAGVGNDGLYKLSAKASGNVNLTATEGVLSLDSDDPLSYAVITDIGDNTVSYQDATTDADRIGIDTADGGYTIDISPAVEGTGIEKCITSLSNTSYKYNGEACEPEVKVEYGMSALKEGTDFKVSYENNVDPGTAKAIITGMGNYIGSVSLEFTIEKTDQDDQCTNGHTFGTWTTTKEATEQNAGEKTRICTVCGFTETQVIPKIAPSDTPSTPDVTPPTPVDPQPAPIVTPAAPAEIVDLPAVKISKPKAVKKKITVKWKKVSKKNLKKISGIQIQVATDPAFTNIVKTATAGKKKTSKVIKGLAPKTKYYVRIRAYAAGNHVSAWKSKSVKVK